jgi:putative DNA methylase
VLAGTPASGYGEARLHDAALPIDRVHGQTYSTDPPYYDNVPYADLSDFFYVWLRRSLAPIYPELFGTVLVPKAQELVAEPSRHGGRDASRRFFEEGMGRVFANIRDSAHPDVPTTVFLRLQAG